MHVCTGLARTLYIRCVYGVFGREITKYTVKYGAYIRFWPTLCMYHYICAQEIYIWLWHTLPAFFAPFFNGIFWPPCRLYIYIWLWHTLPAFFAPFLSGICGPFCRLYSWLWHTLPALIAPFLSVICGPLCRVQVCNYAYTYTQEICMALAYPVSFSIAPFSGVLCGPTRRAHVCYYIYIYG